MNLYCIRYKDDEITEDIVFSNSKRYLEEWLLEEWEESAYINWCFEVGDLTSCLIDRSSMTDKELINECWKDATEDVSYFQIVDYSDMYEYDKE